MMRDPALESNGANSSTQGQCDWKHGMEILHVAHRKQEIYSLRIGYTARDIHLLRFRLGLFWAEHTFGRIPQRHTKKNRPIWYRINSHCWSSKQYFARDGTNQHGPLTWGPSKSNKPPYDRDTDGKAKVRWLTNRKEGPGMGGSENRTTYAPNSSQTRYISVRWNSRDQLFPYPPILWIANCFPSKIPSRYNKSKKQTVHAHC